MKLTSLLDVEIKIKSLKTAELAYEFFNNPSMKISEDISEAFYQKYSNEGKRTPFEAIREAFNVDG